MPEAPTRKLETDYGPDRPRRRFSPAMKAGVLVVALLFALAAGLSGRGSDAGRSNGGEVIAPTSTVTGADLALRVPRGWSRLKRSPDLGLPLSHATAVAPRSRNGPVVVFGVARGRRASNGALLPATFLSSTGQSTGAVPRRSAVRLPDQNLEAWRYPGLRPIGNNRQLTVFTVPTSSGVAIVACALPPEAAAAFAAQCDAIAGTLQLRSGRAYPIGASDAYASSLNGTIGELQQTTKSGKTRSSARRRWLVRRRPRSDCQRLRGRRRPARRARPEPSRQGGKCAAGRGAPSGSQRVPPGRARRHCRRPGRVSRRECRGPGRQAGGELRPRGRARSRLPARGPAGKRGPTGQRALRARRASTAEQLRVEERRRRRRLAVRRPERRRGGRTRASRSWPCAAPGPSPPRRAACRVAAPLPHLGQAPPRHPRPPPGRRSRWRGTGGTGACARRRGRSGGRRRTARA